MSVLSALFPVVSVPARAQGPDEVPGPVLVLHADVALEHDSNILRAENAVSDEIGVFSAGLRLDKRYSLQRVTLQAQANRFRFRDFSNLDYSTLTYDGAWNFQVTPSVRGVLSADRRQYRDITNASTSTGDVRLRTERRELAEVTLLGRGGWRTLAGLDRYSSRSDDPRALEASPTVSSLHIGGGYESAAGALLTAQVRRGDGDYGGSASGIGFRETEPSVSLLWPATAKTALEARIGYLDRSHDEDRARDFKGLVARGAVRWTYSPRTSVEAGFARDLGSYEFNGGGRIHGWRLYLAPAWRPSEKTALRLRHTLERRDWSVLSSASPDLGREDRTRWSALTLEWTPRRLLEFTLSARQEHRHSNLPGLGFRANVVALGARLNF
jgi:exopolysaccharide biosynthesis operon protein EpsL